MGKAISNKKAAADSVPGRIGKQLRPEAAHRASPRVCVPAC